MKNDLISRQDAIELIENESRKWGDEYGVSDVLCDLSDMPSAQPDVSDREVGEWIVVERHEHYPSGKPYEQVQCPFCKRFDNNGDGSFCGYCGARMGERRGK